MLTVGALAIDLSTLGGWAILVGIILVALFVGVVLASPGGPSEKEALKTRFETKLQHLPHSTYEEVRKTLFPTPEERQAEEKAKLANSTSQPLQCPSCHNQLQKEQYFCPNCGHDLAMKNQQPSPILLNVATVVRKQYCAYCGEAIQSQDQFCGTCGRRAG